MNVHTKWTQRQRKQTYGLRERGKRKEGGGMDKSEEQETNRCKPLRAT